MDIAATEKLFTELSDDEREVWPDFRLLSSLVLLSSEGCVPGHFAIHWRGTHDDHIEQFLDYFPFAIGPGCSCTSQSQTRVNGFCRLIWDSAAGLKACLGCKLRAEETTLKTRLPFVYECHGGLTDIAVPVCSAGTYLGTLFTGQMLRRAPSTRKFSTICRKLSHLKHLDMDKLSRAYMKTPVISEPDLRRTVNTLVVIADHIGRLWTKTERLLEQERRYERVREYERKELVERIVFGRNGTEPVTVRELRDFNFSEVPTVVLVVRVDNLDTITYGERQSRREIVFGRAVSHLQNAVEKLPNTLAATLSLGEVVVLTRPLATRNPHLKKLVLSELGQRILEVFRRTSGLTGVVGIGKERGSISELHESYHEALNVALRWDGDERHRVMQYDDVSLKRAQPNELLGQLQESLCDCLRRSDGREADHILTRMSDWVRAGGHMTTAAQQPFMVSTMERLAATAVDCGCDGRQMIEQKSRWLDELLVVSSPDELHEWMEKVNVYLFDQVEKTRLDRISKLVAKARGYIEQNRTRRVSLEEAAEHVGLSPSYFRHKFKEITGIGFMRFQMKARMREASRLLLDPNLSVTNLALMLGYDSVSQFARSFRKYVGVSPNQYRANPQKYCAVLQ